jgi:glycosyltransferase involved in cell wall biosynthesis
MQGLSAVIITRNEAHNIVRCLRALKGLCTDVVVVDAESSDDTVPLARAEGARVIVRAWTDYSDQKNFANAQAVNPWILSLDADEELSGPLRASITSALAKGLSGAYTMHRLTNYCGQWVRHGGWYPDTKVRIFHRDQARWEGSHVHETIALAEGTPVHHLQGDLLHYSYPTLASHAERIERYSTLHAQKLFATGKRASLVKRWLSPVAKFISSYLVQAGVLDGRAGWHIARLSAKAVYLKYAKLHALHHGRA